MVFSLGSRGPLSISSTCHKIASGSASSCSGSGLSSPVNAVRDSSLKRQPKNRVRRTHLPQQFLPTKQNPNYNQLTKTMATTSTQPTEQRPTDSEGKTKTARLFFLDASSGRLLSANPDGSDKKVIATGGRVPDGIAVDTEAGHIYWTNMGVPTQNDGSIERVDLDGQNRTTIIPKGGTFTPKQLTLDRKNRKLYWCDREGMRVMRSNLDGSKIKNRLIYWTDRGNPPTGNSVSRAPMDADFKKRPAHDIVVTDLMEGIGIALGLAGDRMFVTDLAGDIYSARLDGSGKKVVLAAQGNLTGIAYAETPNNRK